MKGLFLFLLLIAGQPALLAQNSTPPTTLRGVLLEQLRTAHDQEDWFVPASQAVAGLTGAQAAWSPGKGQHSVGQLAYRLWFWDSRALMQFNGVKPPAFDRNNDETFNNFDPAHWDDLVKNLNQVLADWEKAVESADDKKLTENASLIAHIGAHNAYHVEQILYVRKLQGVWDPSKGVH